MTNQQDRDPRKPQDTPDEKPIHIPDPKPSQPGFDENNPDLRHPSQQNPGQRK